VVAAGCRDGTACEHRPQLLAFASAHAATKDLLVAAVWGRFHVAFVASGFGRSACVRQW